MSIGENVEIRWRVGLIFADNISIMGDMKTKQWKIGDKVTPIQGYLKGVPCVIKWVCVIEGAYDWLVTVETVHGCWRSIHPNNLKKI